MPGQTPAGLPLPSTLVGGAGGRPTAMEEVQKQPCAHGRHPQPAARPVTDDRHVGGQGAWRRRQPPGALPAVRRPETGAGDNDAEQAAYLQRGIEGRRQVGGRLPFRQALLAKLGDEAGSGRDAGGARHPAGSPARADCPGGARRRANWSRAVQVQGGRLPALAAARANRVREEITRQHVLSLQTGEQFGQPQISAIIRALRVRRMGMATYFQFGPQRNDYQGRLNFLNGTQFTPAAMEYYQDRPQAQFALAMQGYPDTRRAGRLAPLPQLRREGLLARSVPTVGRPGRRR